MSVIVSDSGFAEDLWHGDFVEPAHLPANDCASVAIDLGPDAKASDLAGLLPRIAMIRISFPVFTDGRGFSIARELRHMGYTGRLRAAGHVLADQYTMARRCGFDEVEIDDDLAHRQPADQWRRRADWRAYDYQSQLRGA